MINPFSGNPGELLLFTSLILIVIGIFGVVTNRNLIKIVIGIEVIAMGVNINFIAISLLKYEGLIDPVAHAYTIISIVLDGAIVGVALALTLIVYRRFRTLDTDKIRGLRW